MSFAEIDMPKIIPTMTLSQTVLFPQSILQLYIFEKRYRRMLADALSSHRMLVLANQKQHDDTLASPNEPPCDIATAAIIRVSSLNSDGTSNVVVQGITRVRIEEIVDERPYRLTKIAPAFEKQMFCPIAFAHQQDEFVQLLRIREKLGVEFPKEAKSIFKNLKNFDAISDLAAHAFCPKAKHRQRLLETPDPEKRMKLLVSIMAEEIETLKIKKTLQGDLPDQDIPSN